MQLVLVGPAPPWGGGIASFTTTLARSLESLGLSRWISWRVPRLRPPSTCLAVPRETSARAEPLLGIYDPGSWRAAGRLVRGASGLLLTVTHPALYVPYRELVRGYRRGGGRVVLVCHNVVAHEAFLGQRMLARRLLSLADTVVTHSRTDCRIARRLTDDRVRVIEAFHPTYDEHATEPWPDFPGERRLLAFGHVRAYKGLPDLVAALAHLPDTSLDVVGRFERAGRTLGRLAVRLGVSDRVRLEDRYVPDNELRDVFAGADAVVAPYRQASQSGVVHLAYAFGRPVVATRVGGLAEAVTDGLTGALVAPCDPVDLAGGIMRVLAAPPGAFAEGIRAIQETRTWRRYAELVTEALE